MAFPVTLNGRTYTLADFSGTNYVEGFPDALQDFVTQAGNIYTTTSTSSVAIGTGSKTFTVADSGKPYTVGTPLRIADAAAPATNWIDGIVTSYSGTTLVVDAVAYAGSGTKASWNINIGGSAIAYTGTLPVAQGGTGATAAADARANLGLGSAATSAATDFVSQTSATGSAIVPTGTDAQRDGTPSAGYFRFNTDSSSFEGYDGTAWGAVGGSVDLSAVNQDILPDADSTRDIGSTSARWAQGWFDDVTAGTADINGGTIDGTVIGGSTPAAISGTDLTLSGGVYVGGTGAANYLDDYETGTWTPVISGETSAGTGIYTLQSASYVKVGKMVSIVVRIEWTAHTGTGAMTIPSFPFTTSSDNQAAFAIMHKNLDIGGSNKTALVYIGTSSTTGTVYGVENNVNWTAPSMDSAGSIIFSGVYEAA